MRSIGHGYARTEKFNTLMNIPKPVTVNNYNKIVSKIIDVANFVDVVYQRYLDKEIRVCHALSKPNGNPFMKPKEKRKTARSKVRGAVLQMPQLIDYKIMQAYLFVKLFGPEKYEINFFSFLVSFCFK